MLLGDSEMAIAQRFADAGKVYEANPMAVHLRGMNMLYEVMKAGGTSTVIAIIGGAEYEFRWAGRRHGSGRAGPAEGRIAFCAL